MKKLILGLLIVISLVLVGCVTGPEGPDGERPPAKNLAGEATKYIFSGEQLASGIGPIHYGGSGFGINPSDIYSFIWPDSLTNIKWTDLTYSEEWWYSYDYNTRTYLINPNGIYKDSIGKSSSYVSAGLLVPGHEYGVAMRRAGIISYSKPTTTLRNAEGFTIEAGYTQSYAAPYKFKFTEPYRREATSNVPSGAIIGNYGSSGQTGIATTTLPSSGTYEVKVWYFDESDGVASYEIKLNGKRIEDPENPWLGDRQKGDDGGSSNAKGKGALSSKTFTLTFNKGDTFTLEGTRGTGELARYDRVDFTPVKETDSCKDGACEVLGDLEILDVSYELSQEPVTLFLNVRNTFSTSLLVKFAYKHLAIPAGSEKILSVEPGDSVVSMVIGFVTSKDYESNFNTLLTIDADNSFYESNEDNNVFPLELRAFCGDGVLNSNEQCDDGNTVNGDGCSSSCQQETTQVGCEMVERDGIFFAKNSTDSMHSSCLWSHYNSESRTTFYKVTRAECGEGEFINKNSGTEVACSNGCSIEKIDLVQFGSCN